MPRLTLYTKPGCHLCDEALKVIERVREDLPFELEEVDIRSEPGLRDRYEDRIPVVLVNGFEVFELRVEEAALRETVASRLAAVATSDRVG